MALKAGRVGVRKDQVDVNGIIDMSNVPTELPSYSSSDEGKMLTVDSSGDLEFSNVPTELPSYSSSDEGKVLSVDSSGELEFATITTGGVKLYKKVVNSSDLQTVVDAPSSGYTVIESKSLGFVNVEGYTPLFVIGDDKYTGYTVFGVCLKTKNYQGVKYGVSGVIKRASAPTDAIIFTVYYVKNDEVTITDLT